MQKMKFIYQQNYNPTNQQNCDNPQTSAPRNENNSTEMAYVNNRSCIVDFCLLELSKACTIDNSTKLINLKKCLNDVFIPQILLDSVYRKFQSLGTEEESVTKNSQLSRETLYKLNKLNVSISHQEEKKQKHCANLSCF